MTNGIIYRLKSLPLIKKLLPATLYGSHNLKTLVNIISINTEISSIFVGKGLYLFLIYWVTKVLLAPSSDSFAHIILFLTILGGLLNTHMFNPTKDKFYAICIMRMDARKYALSNYLYFLLKMFIGFLVFTFIFGMLSGMGILTCLLVPIYVVSIKLCYTAQVLNNKKIKNENKPSAMLWTTVALLLIAAFLPPYLGYAVSEMIFCSLAVVLIIPGVFALNYILRFDEYRRIYKELLTPENFAMRTSKEAVSEAQRLAMQKKISIDPSQTSSKVGYQYFNELFMKRHTKLLTKSAKRITLICILLYVIIVAVCFFSPEKNMGLNALLHSSLPYFLFIMYMINRGNVITQAMFMNCDHSMLSYRFYRQPKAILSLFVERLRYIIIINLMPASVIALALPSLLFITGGTDQPVNYILLFVSILAMSVFFSVHTIVLYYLMQPYNINLESKSMAYNIANFVTYIVCYYAIGERVPTMIFGSAISLFCLIYVVLAFVLAYKLAPKTFKLK
jgi:hypothetical protein